jgi:glycosyltransferase involved in cell wall biosynthesis
MLSPLLPPLRGGLADHTRELATGLTVDRQVTVVSSRDVYPSETFNVRAVIHDWENVSEIAAELIHAPPDAVFFWQYVPHMYGRGGVNRNLVQLWESLKQEKRKQVFLAHEIAGPWGNNPLHWWYAWNQRRQWRAILRVADLIGISTEAWTLQWKSRKRKLADRMFMLPSSSSIKVETVPPGHRESWRETHVLSPNLPLMAWFGTVAASKQLPWVLNAWEQVNKQVGPMGLCILGGTPSLPIPSTLRPLYRSLGYLPAEEISKSLQAMDLMALPYVDGASERRTTLMSGLSHGVAVATTAGHNTGPSLKNAAFLSIAPATNQSAFIDLVVELARDSERRKSLAALGKQYYEAHYSWNTVVKVLEDQFAHHGLA